MKNESKIVLDALKVLHDYKLMLKNKTRKKKLEKISNVQFRR